MTGATGEITRDRIKLITDIADTIKVTMIEGVITGMVVTVSITGTISDKTAIEGNPEAKARG